MLGNRCKACGLALVATSAGGIFEHAGLTACSTTLLDAEGESLDASYELVDGVIYEREVDVAAVAEIAEPTTTVVHCKHAEYDVYIGRGSPWGNPFATEAQDSKYPVNLVRSKDEAISRYHEWLTTDLILPGWRKPSVDQIERALRGKRLGCYCAPATCHGDVLAAIADGVAAEVADLLAPPTMVETEDHLVLDDPSAPFPLAPLAPLARAPKSLKDFFLTLDGVEAQPFYAFDLAIDEIFEAAKAPKLGGASGGLGWSSFSTFQQCPYKWRRMQVDGVRGRESQALVIGSCVHVFLAVHYMLKMDAAYPLTPRGVYEALAARGCNMAWVDEAWRLYDLYSLFYAHEPVTPLAVEYLVVDPKTGESCRYDLIARVDKAFGSFAPGVYWFDHKTCPRVDDTALTGWRGDGEIIGQAMLWHRTKLSKKFGKDLRGCIINLIPKTKDPAYTRVAVNVMPWQIKAHARDLQQWQALRNLFISLDTFPRARASCINRYGKCQLWDHCADSDRDV